MAAKMAASVCTTRVLNLPGIKQFLGIVDRLGKTGRSFSDRVGREASINLYHRDIVTSRVCEEIFSVLEITLLSHMKK